MAPADGIHKSTAVALSIPSNAKVIILYDINEYDRRKLVVKRIIYKNNTLYKTTICSDTIRLPIPVERKLTPWERTVFHAGKLLVGILAAVAVWLIAWIARRKLKA